MNEEEKDGKDRRSVGFEGSILFVSISISRKG